MTAHGEKSLSLSFIGGASCSVNVGVERDSSIYTWYVSQRFEGGGDILRDQPPIPFPPDEAKTFLLCRFP